MEVWKDIKGYEGVYQVSNLGRVRRLLKNNKAKILKDRITKDGYRSSIKEASQKLKISPNNISWCCRGHLKTAGNYIWRYKEAVDI